MKKNAGKLELVKGTAATAIATLTGTALPKSLKKLSLPPLVKFGEKPGQIAVGMTVSGALLGLVENITGKTEMRGSKTIHLRHESGTEFLIPFTGTIKSTFRQLMDEDGEIKKENLGKVFFFTRQPDGFSDKFKKAQFNIDVQIAE
jgi:hypothetical protein